MKSVKGKLAVVFFIIGLLPCASWAAESPFPPLEGSENIIILRVQYITPSPHGEYIVLLNTGDVTVDISDWVIFDSYYNMYRRLPINERIDPLAWEHMYKIPYGVVLKPKYWVRICSEQGQDNELYLYRCLSQPWLEEGETLYLADNRWNVIDEYTLGT